MTRWLKSGIIFSSVYFVLIILFLIGALFNIGGSGEGNLFGWLLIFSGYPLVWLLNLIGIKAVISSNTSIFLWMIIQGVIVFIIGAFFGQFTSKIKLHQKLRFWGDK
jgi:amino acid transporter